MPDFRLSRRNRVSDKLIDHSQTESAVGRGCWSGGVEVCRGSRDDRSVDDGRD
jgi:hypothetical protein